MNHYQSFNALSLALMVIRFQEVSHGEVKQPENELKGQISENSTCSYLYPLAELGGVGGQAHL
jgi:hypothetical protein